MNKHKQLVAIFCLSVFMVGCGHDDDDDNMTTTPPPPPAKSTYSYEVTIHNLTNNQPLSPFSVVSHAGGTMIWQLGEAASEGIEHSAESGDNTNLLASVISYDANSGAGVIMPGMSDVLMLKADDDSQYLSIISMLVNTNDAFTGLVNYDLTEMTLGQVHTMSLPVYDAGTEANSELAATIPGPAGSGEGFNAMRDDRDFVTRHAGVVSMDDGLMGSALDQSHRFESVVAVVTIERVE